MKRQISVVASRTAGLTGVAAWGVVSFGVASAQAQASALESVRGLTLSYEVPAGCPDGDGFSAEVERRLPEAPVPSATGVAVAIRAREAGYLGELTIEQQGGEPQRREVVGDSCAEVVDALAVVAAIALRDEKTAGSAKPDDSPESHERQPPAAKPAATEKEASDDASDVGSDAADNDEVPERFVGSVVIGPNARHRTFEVTEGTVRLDVVTDVTAHAGATFGLVRGTPIPRYELAFNGALFLTTPDGHQEMAALLPQLRVGFMGPAVHGTGSERLDVYGATFDLGVCYSPHYDSRGWVMLACASYGGGVLGLVPDDSDAEESTGFGRVGLAVESNYNFSKYVHLVVRAGAEGYILGDGSPRSQSVLVDSGWPSLFATFGLGVHF